MLNISLIIKLSLKLIFQWFHVSFFHLAFPCLQPADRQETTQCFVATLQRVPHYWSTNPGAGSEGHCRCHFRMGSGIWCHCILDSDISDQHFMINSKERGVLWNVFRDTFLIFAVWRRESIWMDWFRLILMQRLGNYVHWQQIDWTRLEEKDIDVATSHNGLVVRYRQSQWLHCLFRYPSIRQVVLCACGLGFVAYGPSMLTDVGIWFNALHRISGHSTNSLNHQHVPCR